MTSPSAGALPAFPRLLRILLAWSVTCAATVVLRADESRTPAIGMWHTVWWTKDDQFHHWVNCHRLPVRGRYTAGEPDVIADHYSQFRDLGVDFLIMDDTNCAGNDGGRINDNIRAWFDFMDARPPAERIPIGIGGGGEMRGEGAAGQTRAADFYHSQWARRPSYFHLEGKPLLLVDHRPRQRCEIAWHP